jgi:predicted AAA+ superfamily ATPase
MLYSRNIENKITHSLRYFPVVVLIGSRQSGKTTLAKKLKPDWKYFDLEKGSDKDFICSDFDFFFEQYPDSIIIDEAQLSPELFSELRGVVDANRSEKGRFILTGSSSPELNRHISESLAGRVAIIEVGTCKMNEVYQFPLPDIYNCFANESVKDQKSRLLELVPKIDNKLLMEHFLKGGYPEVNIIKDEDFHSQWMENYQQTYLERDLRNLFPNMNIDIYRLFMNMLAELSGTIINRSEIGRTLNISEKAIRTYLQIAEGTFLWRNLTSLESVNSKSIVKMPRGYIRDSGLLHHLVGISSVEKLFSRSATGSAFEGFIVEEIIQGLKAASYKKWKYNYYRTRGGAEVDLVITHPEGDRIPVEIKFGKTIKRNQLRSLQSFIENENCPYGLLINNSDEVRLLTQSIIQIPASCL